MSTPQNLLEIQRRGGRVWWEFWRMDNQSRNIRHEIKAAACVTRDWPGSVGEPAWESAAAAWGIVQAQAVCDRLDIEEPRAVRIATAVEDLELRIANEVCEQLDLVVAYLDAHPGVTAEQVRTVLRPRVVDVISEVRGLTAGF